jgi:DNA-binding transcriptional MerR regulator
MRRLASEGVAEDRLLTTSEAAKAMGLSRATLASYARRGLLTPRMVLPTGHYRWSLPDIERQLRELRKRGEEE